jgi:ABC-type polysaccharide/polyol phosphate transport system ATPase subunit
MKKEIAIRLQDVTKTYLLYNSHADRVKEMFHPLRKQYHNPHHALQNVSLEIKKGEFVGIIGRNGSGKSTLLQLVSGILKPTGGSIKVNGTISALLELGAGFNPEFTGRDNVFLNASILGFSNEEIERRFSEIEDFADIGDFIDQPVKTYSSGMYVRLAFAVAVCVKPEILIVDEALAVGDMFFQQKCIRHMEKVMKDCTKVLVTHDMHAVTNLCERVYVLDHGKLIFEGDPLKSVELYTKALHNELFASSENRKDERTQEIGASVKAEVSQKEITIKVPWIEVKEESTAGASDVVIRSVRMINSQNEAVVTVCPNDTLIFQMLVEAYSNIDDPIFGYMVKDRVGNAICGDNTLSLPDGVDGLTKGDNLVSFEIQWPDIVPSDYLVTFGVGQGHHPLHHVIQCWAHNVLLVKAVNPGAVVHGLFTNQILQCEVRQVD